MHTAKDFAPILWASIEAAGGDRDVLRRILGSKPKSDIILFHREVQRAWTNLWHEIDTAKPRLPAPWVRLSEDTLEDIFSYVVSQGAAYYDHILTSPEELRLDVTPSEVPFLGVPREVFIQHFGEEIDLQA